MFWISSKYLPEAPLCTMSLWKFDVSPGARRMTSGIMTSGIMTKLCSSSILVLAADAEMFGVMVTLPSPLLPLLVVTSVSSLL